MTSPNQPEPNPTSDKYDDVHSQGSRFGQDLTEKSVRTMLRGQTVSPFQGALSAFGNAIGGLISGIAQAITGGGGAQFTEIAAAVETRLGPIDTMITESGKRHEELAGVVEANSEAQVEINKEIRDEAQQSWNALQTETNHVVQEQLWQHQDMIELLDIRAPKTYGFEGTTSNKVVCPYHEPDNPTSYWANSYVEVWGFSRTVVVAARGDWVGAYEISINWDNGVIDNYVHTINKDWKRVGLYSGGGLLISRRHITITVSPRSLLRTAHMTVNAAGTEWYEYENPPTDLVRYYSGDVLRLRNAATSNMDVVIQNEEGVLETIPAGDTIPATEIRASEQPTKNWVYRFYELDDPSVDYTHDKTRPAPGPDAVNTITFG